jgi:four helix bundle protein
MSLAKSFRDLNVYADALREATTLFELTHAFPREERYALTDQVRRSSRATGALIAEAWRRRRYRKAFAAKLTEALGEATETRAWLDHALAAHYIVPETHARLDRAWADIAGRIYRMVQHAHSFCEAAPS